MEKIRTRAEVDQETTWDLRDLFVTDVEWEQELRSLPEAAAQIETFKGRLGEGAEQLLACLDAREALQERIGKTASYARLKQSEDSTNPVNIENSAKAGDILSNLSSSLSFVNSEIVELPDGTVERYIQELPGLEPYGAFDSGKITSAYARDREGTRFTRRGTGFAIPYLSAR